VTGPIGYNHAGGALTVPIKTQIANHLARFTTFKSSDLIFLIGGLNETFIQFETFAATAAQVQADAAAGKITADQANLALFQAQTLAQAEMKKAALELAGYVGSEILAKGGKYVAVLNPYDLAQSPFGGTLPASVKPVLTGLIDVFNLWLREGLTGQPVLWIDSHAFFQQVISTPATFGFSNVTVPACDAAKIQAITSGAVTSGSSLFCSSTPGAPYNGLRTGADATTWLFADGVHPSTGGHKALSDEVAKQLKAAGWI
jgi:phospholipase/lecithinase/hemolysin